jgi:DNA-binding response OmpR family regulator
MRKVIFVDDEPKVLDGIRRNLPNIGAEWQVDFCSSGERALEVMENEDVDVVVTDMQMPGMSGQDLILEMRQRYPAITPIVLSGQCSDQDKKQISLAGIRFFPKPFDVESLVAEIRLVRSTKEASFSFGSNVPPVEQLAETVLILAQALIESGVVRPEKLPKEISKVLLSRVPPERIGITETELQGYFTQERTRPQDEWGEGWVDFVLDLNKRW